jgi:hypothetical protein
VVGVVVVLAVPRFRRRILPAVRETAPGHRVLTAYLPPIAGFFAMKRLEREGYL